MFHKCKVFILFNFVTKNTCLFLSLPMYFERLFLTLYVNNRRSFFSLFKAWPLDVAFFNKVLPK